MSTLYEITFGLLVLLDIGLLFAVILVGPRWLYIKWKDCRMSRSETIENGIIYEIEDPFGEDSGFEMNDGLRETRRWLAERFRAGISSLCPACGQTVKKYQRPIYAKMVAALQYIHKNPGAKSEQLRFFGGGDFAKLVHWGLLEQDKDQRWRCTPKGLAFLEGEIRVAKYVYIYNAVVFGRSEETVDVHQCWGKPFSLEEAEGTPPEITSVAAE